MRRGGVGGGGGGGWSGVKRKACRVSLRPRKLAPLQKLQEGNTTTQLTDVNTQWAAFHFQIQARSTLNVTKSSTL